MERVKIYWLSIVGGLIVGLLFAVGKSIFGQGDIDGILMLAIIFAGSIGSFILLKKVK